MLCILKRKVKLFLTYSYTSFLTYIYTPAYSAWLSCHWQVQFALHRAGGLLGIFCSSDRFLQLLRNAQRENLGIKSFQLRNLRVEIAVMKCLTNALRC